MDGVSSDLPSEWQVFASTKYPAKSYYFNVRTGKAAWNLSEINPEEVNLNTESKVNNLDADIKVEICSTKGSNNSSSVTSKGQQFSSVNNQRSSDSFSYVLDDSNASDTSDVHSTTSADSLPQTLKTRKWQSKKNEISVQPKAITLDNSNQTKKIKLTRPSFGSTKLASTSKIASAVEMEEHKRTVSSPVCKRKPLPAVSHLQVKKSALKVSPSKELSGKRVQFTISGNKEGSKSNQGTPTSPVLSLPALDKEISAENDEMPMEVDEPIDEEKMLVDIQEVRESLKGDSKTVCGELTTLTTNYPSKIDAESKSNILCLVIDTNIFISELKFLKHLPEDLCDLNCEFIFLVPWVVLQELDALKNPYLCSNVTPSVIKQARNAVNYLHEELSRSQSHIKGQSIMEACITDTHAENADDRVLQCCLHYSRKKNFAVILFSNDKNLCNKAIVSNVTSCTKSNIMQSISFTVNKVNQAKKPPDKFEPITEKITSKTTNNVQPQVVEKSNFPKCNVIPVPVKKLRENFVDNDKSANINLTNESLRKSECLNEPVCETSEFDKSSQLDQDIFRLKSNIEEVLHDVFSAILKAEMENVYADMWLKIVLKKPPWTLKQIFDCMKKHWIAVFGFFLKKNDSAKLDDIILLLRENITDPHHTLKWIDKVLVNAVALLMSCQNHSEYDGVISKSLTLLTEFNKHLLKLRKLSNDSTLSRRKEQVHVKTLTETPSSDNSVSLNLEAEKCPKNYRKRLHEEDSDSSYEHAKRLNSSYISSPRIKHSSPLHQNRTLSDSSSSGTSQAIQQSVTCVDSKAAVPDITKITNMTASSLPNGFARNVFQALGCIWDSLNHYCGVICDSLGVKHTLTYVKLEQLPPREETLTFLPRIFPSVHRIFKALRKVLAVESTSSSYTDSCHLLYTALVNFYPSIDSKDEENIENLLTPEMLITFCRDTSYRPNLSRGLWQLEGFRSLLQQCISSMKTQHSI